MFDFENTRRSKAFPIILMSVTGVMVLGLLLLVRIPSPPTVQTAKGMRVNVGVLRLDSESSSRLLRQEALLKDPAPLFLPTEWNSAMYVKPERSLQRPGDTFRGYPAKLDIFGVGAAPVALPPPVSVPGEPAAALDHMDSDRPFVSLGQKKTELAVFPARGVLAEVCDAGSGELRLRAELGRHEFPGGIPWAPAQFIVQINAVGLVGRPCLIVSSGVESVDSLLEQSLRFQWPKLVRQAHLQPGLYRIVLGP